MGLTQNVQNQIVSIRSMNMPAGNYKFSSKMGGNKVGDGKMSGKMGGGKMNAYVMGKNSSKGKAPKKGY